MGRDRWARLFLALCAVAVLGLGLTGCGGGGGGSSSSSSTHITGVVVDRQTNDPIVGATVRAGGRSARTSDSGAFDLGVPAGNITVTISASGYQTGTFTAVADEGLRTNVGILTLLSADNNPPSPPV
jgi:hypothetical protein